MFSQTEASLSALMESAEDPIWAVDAEFRLRTFNEACRRICEHNFGVVSPQGMSPLDFPPEANGPDWARLYERALSEGAFRCEYSLSDAQTLELSFKPILVDGKPAGVSVFGKDISERKRTEDRLHESLETLKETQAIGELGSYSMDFRSGLWTGTDLLDEILGLCKDDEHSVAAWLALIHPGDRERMTAYFIEEVIGKRKAFDNDYRIVRQTDHAERWVHGKGTLE